MIVPLIIWWEMREEERRRQRREAEEGGGEVSPRDAYLIAPRKRQTRP